MTDVPAVIVTWTTLRAREPVATAPWQPCGATWWQAGHSGSGSPESPLPDGRWWSVLATWASRAEAEAGPAAQGGVDGDVDVWHVVMQAASRSGDPGAVGPTGPFDGVPAAASVHGAAGVVTFAGPALDDAREREFFRRFLHLGRDLARAPGCVAAQLQAPVEGPVLTFTAWDDVRTAQDWAYARSLHAGAVARQRSHGLVATSGSLRCAVLSSSGALGDRPDPLAGRTGSVVRRERAQHDG